MDQLLLIIVDILSDIPTIVFFLILSLSIITFTIDKCIYICGIALITVLFLSSALSSEFNYVYRGKTDKESVFDDTVCILQRAIVSADMGMTMTTDQIDEYTGLDVVLFCCFKYFDKCLLLDVLHVHCYIYRDCLLLVSFLLLLSLLLLLLLLLLSYTCVEERRGLSL